MEMENNLDQIEPYKVLFPIGILCSILGVFQWIFYRYGMIHFYPRNAHGNLMYFGFMWAFIVGFLMTAIPKMTGTKIANWFDIGISVFLIFLQVVFSIRNEVEVSAFVFLLQVVFMGYFLFYRVKSIKKIPFWGFVFIPVAFLLNIAGVVAFLVYKNREVFLLLSGEAFVLNLILGLGSRLIPVISRLPNALMPNVVSSKSDMNWLNISFVAILNASFIAQVVGFSNFGIALRAFAIIFALIKYFRIFSKPVQWSVVGIGLKFSAVFLLIGTVGNMPIFQYALAAQHLLFISGFVLLTMLISTRVVLAHGGQSLTYEVSAKKVFVFILCLALSGIARFFAGYNVSSDFIIWSAALFLIGIAMWLIKLVQVEFSKTA